MSWIIKPIWFSTNSLDRHWLVLSSLYSLLIDSHVSHWHQLAKPIINQVILLTLFNYWHDICLLPAFWNFPGYSKTVLQLLSISVGRGPNIMGNITALFQFPFILMGSSAILRKKKLRLPTPVPYTLILIVMWWVMCVWMGEELFSPFTSFPLPPLLFPLYRCPNPKEHNCKSLSVGHLPFCFLC